jgi:rhodanese-related sulfurtransferase
MRIWLCIAMVLIFGSGTIYAQAKKETPVSLDAVSVVTAKSVKKWIDSGVDVVLLDTRKVSDFEEGHLPEADNCPVPGDLDLGPEVIKKSAEALKECKPLKKLKKDATIVAYCFSQY